MQAVHNALIFLFPDDDPRSVRQRLQHSIAGFCGANGIPLPPPEALLTARTERGKPYFPHCPQLHFSISHSGKYWGCAVSDHVIGFDVQVRESPRRETEEEMIRRHQKMAGRFFHPLEAEFVSLNCRHNFLTVWTAREAYVKHTGQGIDQYFSEHCVIPDNREEWSYISGNPGNISWTATGKFFWKTCPDSDYTLCICTDAPCECTIAEI